MYDRCVGASVSGKSLLPLLPRGPHVTVWKRGDVSGGTTGRVLGSQGWRLEVKRYARLTEFGAWRAGTGGEERYGGFYTQDQVGARAVLPVP